MTYTATAKPATVTAMTVERENSLVLAAMLINAEAGGESDEGQKEVFGNIMARVECSQFPDTVEGVVYEKGQYDGVGSKRFVLDAKIYKKVLKWEREDYVGYLWFLNHQTATDTTFVNWANEFEQKKQVGNHTFFGKCETK